MKSKTIYKKPITLITNDESHRLQLNNFESFGGGSYKCNVFIKSGPFSFDGGVHFDEVDTAVKQLEKMAIELKGHVKLAENYHDHYLSFKLTELGHLIVKGHFIEYSEHAQSLEFEFVTDQTSLNNFIRSFNELLASNS
jgi:hypothetical protein